MRWAVLAAIADAAAIVTLCSISGSEAMRGLRWMYVAAAVLALPHPMASALHAAPPAAATTEDARLTAFLDAEFAKDLKFRPQLATRLGIKEGDDRLDDISDAAQLQRLESRRGSVARMKAQFDRSKLSPAGQTNYDIWETELERMELQYKYRRYQPPFYSFLYSVHSQLPDFLINTHTVQEVADMRAYNARIRAIPAVLDTAIAQTKMSDAQGIRAPKFEIERVISGSRALISGAPFDSGKDSPLLADAKAKVAKLKISAADADALLSDTKRSLLTMKPARSRFQAAPNIMPRRSSSTRRSTSPLRRSTRLGWMSSSASRASRMCSPERRASRTTMLSTPIVRSASRRSRGPTSFASSI
jgi:hypothetical protein